MRPPVTRPADWCSAGEGILGPMSPFSLPHTREHISKPCQENQGIAQYASFGSGSFMASRLKPSCWVCSKCRKEDKCVAMGRQQWWCHCSVLLLFVFSLGFFFSWLGIEHRILKLLSKCSTIELHPRAPLTLPYAPWISPKKGGSVYQTRSCNGPPHTVLFLKLSSGLSLSWSHM